MESLWVDLLMKITRRLHNGYVEFKRAEEKGLKIHQYFGKYQYIYSKIYLFRF